MSLRLAVQAWGADCGPEYKLALLGIAEQSGGDGENDYWRYDPGRLSDLTGIPKRFMPKILGTLMEDGLLSYDEGLSKERGAPYYLADFSAWLDPPEEEPPVAPNPPTKPVGRRAETGYVYVVEGGGYYKIGRAKKLDQRVKRFEIKLPFEIELVCAVRSDDYVTLERDLHERFADKRVNGEWFALTQGDIDYVQGLAE